MPVTQAELEEQVRDALLETSGKRWAPRVVTRWINEALRDIARRSESLATYSTVAAVIGTQQYTLPTDVIRVHRVEWRPTADQQVYPLDYRDFNNMDTVWWTQQTQTEGIPCLYTLWGYPPNLKLVSYPIPSVAGNFRVYYYKMPAELTTANPGATADLPEGWEDAAVAYCEYLAHRRNGDDRWQAAKAEYEAKVEDLIDVTQRFTDQAGMIVNDNNLAIPAWLYGEDW